MLLIVPSILLVTQFTDSIFEFNYGLNYLQKWNDKVDFQNGNIQEIKLVEPDYNPFQIRIEEVMSERPRKWTGPNTPNIYIGTYQSLAKYPKEFFSQFHTVVCDEAHGSKAATLKSILSKTFKIAYNRFGVSGTFPTDDSAEILTIQSVLGPIITEVTANELVKLGTITPMRIKAVIMNHNQPEIAANLAMAKKSGAGREAFQYEKDFIQASEKRLEFIKKIVNKCDKNTLLLFHNIDYGQSILQKLSSEITDKEFYYIDGSIGGKKRNEIKTIMESTEGKTKVIVGSFGTLSTGVSIRNLHFLIMVDSFKSEQIIIQSIGRLLRLFTDKDEAVIFDLVDVFDENMKNILYNHYRERKKFYQNRKYPFTEIKVLL